MSETIQPLILESDSLLMVNALIKNVDNQLEIGNILNSCRAKFCTKYDVSITSVGKQADKAAHFDNQSSLSVIATTCARHLKYCWRRLCMILLQVNKICLLFQKKSIETCGGYMTYVR